jgi:tetratricopeptide (TPR) repeat protein
MIVKGTFIQGLTQSITHRCRLQGVKLKSTSKHTKSRISLRKSNFNPELIRYPKVVYRWWKLWGTLPVMSWVKGASLYRSGRFEEAVSLYRKGLKEIKQHPARNSARIDLAYCLFKSKRFEEAEHELRSVIKSSPKFKDAYLRLAHLKLWVGHTFEAAMALKNALQHFSSDVEIVSLYLICVLDNVNTSSMLEEALEYFRALTPQSSSSFHYTYKKDDGKNVVPTEKQHKSKLYDVAKGMLIYSSGEKLRGLEILDSLCEDENPHFEALLYFSECLIHENRITLARQYLKKALHIRPDYPYTLSLLAKTYLSESMVYNPEYALQLAITACQSSGWMSPRDMHMLAECYRVLGDKMTALLVANKAKVVGTHILGSYRDFKNLEMLIEDLSSGSLV